MTEQWQELKKTIIEMRDNGGTGTQEEVCIFLVSLMEMLEKQPKTNTWSIIKDVVNTSAKHGLIVEQQPCEEQQPDNECANIIDVRNYLWSKINLLRDEFGEDIYFDMFWEIARGIYNDVPHVVPKLDVDDTLKDIFRECGQAYMLGYEDASKKFRTGPGEDCISREAVNVLIDELARAISDERIGISRGRSTATIMRDILHLSSVTPERPKGKWVETPVENDVVTVVFKCSECGMRVVNPYKYCPNCGSYNGGGEDEAND